ncbi:hypothetical protein CDAR_42241 [Caerostris darwini]|uniref:Uncharacterized protein n=1 Tax=Caerostris darwini TaxID=1538125 RepID=A0AAV4RGH2_9ARAC|nr:hypothetical protein CDAR_42241 [Caerostris darwini]
MSESRIISKQLPSINQHQSPRNNRRFSNYVLKLLHRPVHRTFHRSVQASVLPRTMRKRYRERLRGETRYASATKEVYMLNSAVPPRQRSLEHTALLGKVEN